MQIIKFSKAINDLQEKESLDKYIQNYSESLSKF